MRASATLFLALLLPLLLVVRAPANPPRTLGPDEMERANGAAALLLVERLKDRHGEDYARILREASGKTENALPAETSPKTTRVQLLDFPLAFEPARRIAGQGSEVVLVADVRDILEKG